MANVLSLLMVPVVILNIGGGIIGGIWLAFRGEWSLIFLGIGWAIFSPWILSILMLPNLGLAMLAMMFKTRKWVMLIFGFFAQFYINALILATCFFALIACTGAKSGGADFRLIPYLLWSWGMALGPWQYFASKEQDNAFTGITLLFTTIFYLVFLISLFTPPILQAIVLLLILIGQLVILPLINIYLGYQSERESFLTAPSR